jgi:hypothetical protein
MTHYIGLGKGSNATLGTTTDSATHMTLGSSNGATWQYEALRFRQQAENLVNTLFEYFRLALRQLARRGQRRLTQVGGQMGANNKKIALYAEQQLTLVINGWEISQEEAQM